MSADWTGALVILLRFYRCTTRSWSFLVLVCLSADWAGALVPLNSYHSVFHLLLASFLRGCLVALLSLGCSSFSLSLFRVVCWGLCLSSVICFGLLCLSLCIGCCWSVFVPCGVLWCCGFSAMCSLVFVLFWPFLYFLVCFCVVFLVRPVVLLFWCAVPGVSY